MIKKDYVDPFAELQFLELLVSSIVIQNQDRSFENYQLKKDLYPYYWTQKYSLLFQDIPVRTLTTETGSYFDLDKSIQAAYTFGLLRNIAGGKSLMSIINLSEEQAAQCISNTNQNMQE